MNTLIEKEIKRRAQIISKASTCADFLTKLHQSSIGFGYVLPGGELGARSVKAQIHIARFIEQHKLHETNGYGLKKVANASHGYYLEFINELPYAKHANAKGARHYTAFTSVVFPKDHCGSINLFIGESTEVSPVITLVYSAPIPQNAFITPAELHKYQSVLFSQTYAVSQEAALELI